MSQPRIQMIPIGLLDPHPNNPRGPVDPASVDDLVASIREHKILEPLLVAPVRNRSQEWKIDRYLTVAGHRRRAAAELAGLVEVPAIVRDLSPAEQEEVMLVENLQREDLTLLQEARAYRRLQTQYGLTLADVARRVGVDKARVGGRMSILKLPETVQGLFGGRDMPITAVPLLLKVEHPDRQERLAQMISSRRLAVPKLKEMIEKEAEAKATDQAVEKSRGKKPAGGEAPRATPKYSRADAVADLERLNGAALRYSDVLAALNGACGDCGMGAHNEICAACPLPQMVGNLVRGNAAQSV
jgi:ParB family chromosome partitioning protein